MLYIKIGKILSGMCHKVLILGGSGYIGAVVKNHLEKHGFAVSTLGKSRFNTYQHDLKFTKKDSLTTIFQKYDIIICCAWYVGKSDYQVSFENTIWREIYFDSIIPAIASSNPQHVIGVGSCLEYGSIMQGPVNIHLECKPDTEYGRTKLDVMKRFNNIVKASTFTWARLFYVYGGKENETKLVPALRKKIASGEDFDFKKPDIITDFVHVEHIAESVYWIIRNRHAGVVNVGSGSPVRNGDLYNLLKCNEKITPTERKSSGVYSSDVFICDPSLRIRS